MNVALPAVIVFLLLIPGFIVRSRYKRAERTSLDFAPFGEVAAAGVVSAFALHGLWLAAAYLLFDRRFDFGTLLALMGSEPDSQRAAMAAVRADQLWVLGYFASIIIVPFVLAPMVRRAAEDRGWNAENHRLSPIFRFHAPWYYLLSPHAARQNDAEGIAIAAVVDVAGQPVLYTGSLVEYFVAQDGTLDRLVLDNVSRRPFERDKTALQDAPERFYAVEGDYFVLRYAEAITLNLLYYKFEEQTQASGDIQTP